VTRVSGFYSNPTQFEGVRAAADNPLVMIFSHHGNIHPWRSQQQPTKSNQQFHETHQHLYR
jgi:tRNA G37 N-methylase TrmD